MTVKGTLNNPLIVYVCFCFFFCISCVLMKTFPGSNKRVFRSRECKLCLHLSIKARYGFCKVFLSVYKTREHISRVRALWWSAEQDMHTSVF